MQAQKAYSSFLLSPHYENHIKGNYIITSLSKFFMISFVCLQEYFSSLVDNREFEVFEDWHSPKRYKVHIYCVYEPLIDLKKSSIYESCKN